MKPITVRAEHEYQVIFTSAAPEALQPIIEGARQVAIIVPLDLRHLADEMKKRLEPLALEKLMIIEVPEGESQKNVEILRMCWQRLGEANFRRNDSIIGLGGGATTDLAGFVAATWLRGVRWAAIPTSLAGMVDAAIGGKTGINTETGKNLVGSFYSPEVVIVDFEYLKTLPAAELRSGLAEVIKCGFIDDQKILEIIESADDFMNVESHTLHELIERSISVKAKVVSEDLRESFTREVLNYGHTMAHAIERHQNYTWRHGDAVAVGLAYIANLARETGVTTAQVCDRHMKILQKVGLPTSYPRQAWSTLFENMQSDKKARSNGIRFVAVTDEYKVIRLEGIPNDVLARAYERISV